MRSRARSVRLLGGAGALVWGVTWCAVLGAAPARAADDAASPPSSVLPGQAVSVDGRCPEADAELVRATVVVAAIARRQVVPVADGAFHADLTIAAVGPAGAPESRTAMPLTATCSSEGGGTVVAARTIRVAAIGQAQSAGNAVVAADGASPAPSPAAARAVTGASSPARTEPPISPSVPLGALAVALIGTAGAVVLNLRSDQRSAAMARHPAQRGVGREPLRARR